MNNQNKYPNSGALFARQKRTPNSADVGGDFTIDGDVLEYILREARKGSVKLEISGWRKMGRSNEPFTSIKVAIPWKDRQGQMPDRQQPNYQRNNQYQQNSYQNRRDNPPARTFEQRAFDQSSLNDDPPF